MSIPSQVAELWNFLHNEVVMLHGRWNIYRELYGTNPERVALLNRSSPTFFGIFQGVLLDDIQLTLGKLGDPASTFKRSNLTLAALLSAIENLPEPNLAKQLGPLLADYDTACAQVRARRNRDIAHYDLATQLAPKPVALPGLSRQEVENALHALRRFMAQIYSHFENSHMAYEMFSFNDNGNLLLYALKKSLRYDELVEAGKLDNADIISSPYFGA